MRTWMGSKPVSCDLCKQPLTNTFVDGRTKLGPWGMLCKPCHNTHGVGLGTGKGQAYRRVGDQWIDTRDIAQDPKIPDDEIRKLLQLKDGADFDHTPPGGFAVGEED